MSDVEQKPKKTKSSAKMAKAIEGFSNELAEVKKHLMGVKELLGTLQASVDLASEERKAIVETVTKCSERVDALVMSVGSKTPAGTKVQAAADPAPVKSSKSEPKNKTKAEPKTKASTKAKSAKPKAKKAAGPPSERYLTNIMAFHKAMYGRDPAHFIGTLYSQEDVDSVIAENEATLSEMKPAQRADKEQKLVYDLIDSDTKATLRSMMKDEKAKVGRKSAAAETLVEADSDTD